MKLIKKTLLAAGSFAALCAPMGAHAVDVDAGDYTAAPAGTTLGLLYYQHVSNKKLYANGNLVSANAGLDVDVGILRGVKFMDIGGYIVDPQFLIPVVSLKGRGDTASLGSNTAFGDPILAATWWFNKPGEKENFGITPFLWVPVGKYDRNDPLTVGENRWKLALQAGWIRPLTEKVTMDLYGDFTLYGKNKDFGTNSQTLKQDTLYHFQAMLRYHLSPTSDLRVGVAHLTGGETKIDGTAQNNRTSTSKFSFGGSTFVGPKTQVILNLGRDVSVRNGFKEDSRVNVRLLQIF